jgi:hypothetical protein
MVQCHIKLNIKVVVTMSLKVITTDDITKINKQIKALESIIPKDNDKDRIIHIEALR